MTTRTMTETFYLTYDAENRLVEASTVQRSAYEDWDYKKAVTLSYSGSTLTDYDVLIEMDTAGLITAGKMQSECEDLRVTDSDGETQLDYWIEGGCNTSSTQIWAQVPSIPDGGKTLYVYYGNDSATNEEESWSGNFILLYNNSCPAGWTKLSAMLNRFPLGASSYGGAGGSSSHSHAQVSCTTEGSSGSVAIGTGSGGTFIAPGHTHTDARVDVSTTSNVLPPFRNMVFCQSPDLEIDSGLIALFDDSAPSGWTRFSALDDRFPRAASNYGGTGGSTTHTHNTSSSGYNTSTENGTAYASGGTAAAGDHSHTTQAGTMDSANHLPPYLDMVFAGIDSDGYGEAGSIVMFTALPPLGWDRNTDLDDAFPRGASTAGGTGGSTTHSHSVTIETGGPSATDSIGGSGASTATSDHTHSCTTTTDAQSNLPPYTNVIYGQRKDPAASTSLGSEQEVGESGGTVTYRYIYNGDGEMIAETIGLTTTIYIGNIYEKKDQGGTITQKKYYMAGSLRVAVSTKVGAGSWEVNFLLSDHLGSTSITTDDSGDTVSEMRYSPWGSVRFADGVSQTDIGFNGQRSRAESFGLIYFNARWLDPALGRFTQTDTLIPGAENPLAFDRYAEMMNNPIIHNDPSGNCVVLCTAIIGAAFGAAANYAIQIVRNTTNSGLSISEAAKWENINKKELVAATVGGLAAGATMGIAGGLISGVAGYIGVTQGVSSMATGILGGGVANVVSGQVEAITNATWDQISENTELKFDENGRGIVQFTPHVSEFYSDARDYGFLSSGNMIYDFTAGAVMGGMFTGLKLSVIDEMTQTYLSLKPKTSPKMLVMSLTLLDLLEECSLQNSVYENDVEQSSINNQTNYYTKNEPEVSYY